MTRFLMFLAVAGCGRLGFDPLSAVTSDAGGDAGSMGLLAAWSFDEGVGLVAYDASGHGNDLNLVGTPQWVAGHADTALGLAGTTSWGATSAAPVLHMTPAFSIEAWAQIATFDTYRVITDKSSTAAFEYWFGYNPSNQACFLVNQGSLSSEDRIDACTATTITDSGWHHLVATFDGTSVVMYLDGVAGTPKVVSNPPFAATNPVLIGHSSFWDYNPWDGAIDAVRIYQRVLTAFEIANPDAR
ncbi:MAG: LamG domain-containing protein [Kofleriaceae bacterium]